MINDKSKVLVGKKLNLKLGVHYNHQHLVHWDMLYCKTIQLECEMDTLYRSYQLTCAAKTTAGNSSGHAPASVDADAATAWHIYSCMTKKNGKTRCIDEQGS